MDFCTFTIIYIFYSSFDVWKTHGVEHKGFSALNFKAVQHPRPFSLKGDHTVMLGGPVVSKIYFNSLFLKQLTKMMFSSPAHFPEGDDTVMLRGPIVSKIDVNHKFFKH